MSRILCFDDDILASRLHFSEWTSGQLLSLEGLSNFISFLSHLYKFQYSFQVNLALRNLIPLAKFFYTLKNEEDILPIFIVDSLKKQKLLRLVLDLKIEDIDVKRIELVFQLLVLLFEQLLSSSLVFS